MPPSWQLVQRLVFTLAWSLAEGGGLVRKPVLPMAGALALNGIRPAGMLPRWQLSQVVEDGMWADAPKALLWGITTMLGLPAKLAGTTLGPWQVSHPELIPVWMKEAPAKVFMPAAGTRPVGVLLTWQLWHATEAGMCAGARLEVALGSTP
jgi:hypothetical protein